MAVSRSGPRRLDWRAVGRGAAAYLAIAIPCGLLIVLLHGNDSVGNESSLWIIAAVLIILVAPLVGGAVAGAARPRTPFSHGAAAVSLPAGVFLAGRSIVGAVTGSLTASQFVSFLVFLMIFTSLGTVGGYLAFRRWARTA